MFWRSTRVLWMQSARLCAWMSLLVGPSYGGASVTAGDYKWDQGDTAKKVADAPPTQWQVVRVDLWDLLKKPTRVSAMFLAAKGGPAAFDQILLGRTEADLRAVTPLKP